MPCTAGIWLATVVGSVGLALTAGGEEASAAQAQRPPAGSPDPRQMVLRSSDLGGAQVTAQGYYRDTDFPSVISYAREFEDGRVGGTALLYVDSEAEIGRSVQGTASFLRVLKLALGSREGRKLIEDSFAEEFPAGGPVSNLKVGRPVALGVGAGSFDLLVRFRVLGLRVDAHLAAFRVDRVLGLLGVVGEPGTRVSRVVVARLARIMAVRMGVELRPRSTGAPVVSGIPEVGQTLTATRGTWRGDPTSFAFQWQRCDALGLSCVPIPGATEERYLVAEADIGSRIRVAVTARNSVGQGASVSAPSAVVPAVTPPTNVSPPTISGTPQSGQTLTVQGAGTWTGSPSAFAFRWMRCDAAGGACADVPGATGGTYVLGAADVGSTMRVAVTARNAAGEATAVSAPTAVVT